MSRKDRIAARLTEGLHPTRLEIEDESDRHAGHAGWRAEGETHYRVYIVSAAFSGKSAVARHRLVYDQLGEEFAGGLHALAVRARTPDEA
ncbi:MAG: BolA family transcriptional regulator [Hyphomicrobiales bacterium]|nr:BolA family transcriptional regulator [Hyphomicrobiales bacterium]